MLDGGERNHLPGSDCGMNASPLPEVSPTDIEGQACNHKYPDGTPALKPLGIRVRVDERGQRQNWALFKCVLCQDQINVEK